MITFPSADDLGRGKSTPRVIDISLDILQASVNPAIVCFIGEETSKDFRGKKDAGVCGSWRGWREKQPLCTDIQLWVRLKRTI